MVFNSRFFRFFKDHSSNFYIFNKYSFFNVFDYKYGYFFTDRFFFNAFAKDFDFLAAEYSHQMNQSFFKNLSDITHGNLFSVVASVYEEDSISSYEKVSNLRTLSFLANGSLKDKAFYFLLKFFITQDHKLFVL
jgi:hypothetical protein